MALLFDVGAGCQCNHAAVRLVLVLARSQCSSSCLPSCPWSAFLLVTWCRATMSAQMPSMGTQRH
eukprot:10525600-Alexandrium_andersonii.AAC.1